MSDTPSLSGPTYGPASGETKQIVLLLHGVGADGNDLIGLAPYFARSLPDALFVAPNAPYPCDMAPMGYQWFSLQVRTEETMLAGAQSTRPILDAFIDGLLAEYKLGPEKLALVGFSQGTMMSLFVGPRRPQQVAGILGYSGRLVGSDLLAEEVASRPPVALINGDQDELIPVEAQAEAITGLVAAGLEVEGHIHPGLGHSIDEPGIETGIAFLSRVLGVGSA